MAQKNTKVLSITTVVGAITNTVLNVIFVSFWGIIGVAVASLVSTFALNYARLNYLKKTIKIKLSESGNYIAYFILLFQVYVLFRFNREPFYYFVQIILLLSIVYIYRDILLKGWDLISKEGLLGGNKYEDSNRL